MYVVGTLVFHQCLGVGLGSHADSRAFTVIIPRNSAVTVSFVIMKTISSTEISYIDAEIISVIVRIASGRKRIVINMRIIKWIFLNWINRIQKLPDPILLSQLSLRCFQRVFPTAMTLPEEELSTMTHNGPMESNSTGAAMDIYQTLITDLDTEGRYVYLNAIASQEIIQEQITRVLLSSSVGYLHRAHQESSMQLLEPVFHKM